METYNSNTDSSASPSPAQSGKIYLQMSNSTSGLVESIPLNMLFNPELYLATNTPSEIYKSNNEYSTIICTNSECNINSHNNSLSVSDINTYNPVEITINNVLPNKENPNDKQFDELVISEDNIAEPNRDFNEICPVVTSYVDISDRAVPPRAVLSLPSALRLRACGGILPRRPLPARARFGPVLGVIHRISHKAAEELTLKAAASKTIIFLLGRDKESVDYIDVSDKDKSNWLSLLPLGDSHTANLWLCEHHGSLYAVTKTPTRTNTPLTLGYSKHYADQHGLTDGQPVTDPNHSGMQSEQSARPHLWQCPECGRSVPAAAKQRHLRGYHNVSKSRARGEYRCIHCTRTFSRFFTLKRHIRQHCTNKKEDTNEAPIVLESKPDFAQYLAKDDRLPSDESLQNYSNGLDISTNLFDTDRINLDISGKSDDFNPYTDGDKDDNFMPESDVDYNKFSSGLSRIDSDFVTLSTKQNKRTKTDKEKEPLVPCAHCKQTIPKSKKRQHAKKCTAQRLECFCGQIFRRKQALAAHIHKEHDSLTTDTNKREAKETDYKCDKCQNSFKRRGMFVNHLWHVHGSRDAVPLRERARYFPCGVCDRLYHSKAKRDAHLRRHHPDSEPAAVVVLGAERSRPAAACPQCPRQYSTRAKMLQHVRATHPQQATPAKRYSYRCRDNNAVLATVV